MIIGVPTEIKTLEYRVGLVPSSVYELTSLGHEVVVQAGCGLGISVTDHMYREVGATVLDTAEDVYARADLIVKVKEPQPSEYGLLRPNQILFTYLHLAPDATQAKALIDSNCVAIAYETVTAADGSLPLLSPMSEVAGRMSVQAGAHALEKAQGGRGVLLGGVPGVNPAHVVVIGGGVVGSNAIRMAVGMGANVTVIDKSLPRLRELDDLYNAKITTVFSTKHNIAQELKQADLVIGAVLVPGRAAPKLVKLEDLELMQSGSVIVDVAIDQGGCFETSKPTTHQDPTYMVSDVVHYCVANMPGAVARTSTLALNNATLPYVLRLAQLGYKQALLQDAHFMRGLNVWHGLVTCLEVAQELGYEYCDPYKLLA